jgi:hypothetical protein
MENRRIGWLSPASRECFVHANRDCVVVADAKRAGLSPSLFAERLFIKRNRPCVKPHHVFAIVFRNFVQSEGFR